MKTLFTSFIILASTLLIAASAQATGGGGHHQPLDLNILLVNDDGYDSEGITTLKAALEAAGHTVTLVAPATNQSGRGGAINTNALDFTPGVGLMQLTNYGNNTFSLAGTPADSAKAGLEIVMANNPPDLVVTGCNEGQNIGKPGSNTSGTEGAALRGVFSGVPAIACSVGILFQEAQTGFPSTAAAYAPASDFIVRLIDRLTVFYGDKVLPRHTKMLNVNVPVPYEDIQGVKVTRNADGSDIELPLFDPSQGFPSLGVPPLPFPSCADAIANGGACFAAVGFGFSPDESIRTDLGAFREGYISVTPYDADMSIYSWVVIPISGMNP